MWIDTKETILQDLNNMIASLNSDRLYRTYKERHNGEDPRERRGSIILNKIFHKYEITNLKQLSEKQMRFEKDLIITTVIRGATFSGEKL